MTSSAVASFEKYLDVDYAQSEYLFIRRNIPLYNNEKWVLRKLYCVIIFNFCHFYILEKSLKLLKY